MATAKANQEIFFFYNPMKYYNTYLRSTLLTRITLQYYWDEYPRGARGYDYPKGINIDKRKEKKNYLNWNYTTKDKTYG